MTITLTDFIAGWAGGICGVVVGHPLDTIKVRQQTYNSSLLEATRRTYKYEGTRGFFKGLLFPLLTIGPANAILFGVYGNVMQYLQNKRDVSHDISYRDFAAISRILIAGTVGGIVGTIVIGPVEVIKTVLQARTGGKGSWIKHYEVPYKGSFDAFKGIIRDRGVKGLFTGLWPLILRDVPTSGLYILTYEMLMYYNFSQCTTPILIKQTIAGGTAGIQYRKLYLPYILFFIGVVSWIFVFPFDVVKSRIQVDDPKNPKYKGMMDCFVKSYQADGFRIFFKGAPVTLLRTFPVNAALFIGYEAALKRIRPKNPDT